MSNSCCNVCYPTFRLTLRSYLKVILLSVGSASPCEFHRAMRFRRIIAIGHFQHYRATAFAYYYLLDNNVGIEPTTFCVQNRRSTNWANHWVVLSYRVGRCLTLPAFRQEIHSQLLSSASSSLLDVTRSMVLVWLHFPIYNNIKPFFTISWTIYLPFEFNIRQFARRL